eukprot:5152997-Alexandrium_andersonii.AAC.1
METPCMAMRSRPDIRRRARASHGTQDPVKHTTAPAFGVMRVMHCDRSTLTSPSPNLPWSTCAEKK